MKILLLLANSAIEEYFKTQKAKMDAELIDSVYFHSLNYNCSDEDVYKCISNMKPDLVIYRHGKKENKETINFFKEIKIINPAIDIIMLADNISLIFAEQLYSIGVYNLFIGKQIEVMKVIERIIENQKRINSIKENNKKIVEKIAQDVQLVSKVKNNSTFIIAENLLPEGVIVPGAKKRVSLVYYNLTRKSDIFKMAYTIDYYDENGVEKAISFNGFMDKSMKIINELNEFEYKEEEFFEDYRYKYSSYDIIYDNFKVHGNMNWNGLYKSLSEYTKFDLMKKSEFEDLDSSLSYEKWIDMLDNKYNKVEEVIETKKEKKGIFNKLKKK